MGIRLIVEVLDHAPADLTPAERLVLLVIAESANDVTRAGWPGMDLLAHRAGLAPDSVQKVFRRLAKRKLEVRVPVSTDAQGRPVFACRGRQTTYRLPIFPRRERPDARPPIGDGLAGRPSAQSPENGRTTVREWADHGPRMGGPRSAPAPQEPSGNPQQRAAQIVMDATGATAEEARAVVALVEQTDQPRSLTGFLRRLAADGDLTTRLEKVRADRQRQDVSAALAAARQGPPCDHGEAGGASIHPTSGEPICPLCRVALRRNSA